MVFRALLIVLIGLTGVTLPAGETTRFNRDIRPILAKKCFQCHGPDEKERKADLRLDRSGGDDGAYRERKGSRALRAGSLEDSALWYRINADGDDVMPPPGAHDNGAVTAEEKQLIKQWILEGAEYENFWAFVTPRPQAIPQSNAAGSSRAAPLDRFVLARLEKEGLQLNPRANKRTLIRRVTFDLTGLPPTVAEIETFLGNASEHAYESLVDRLLASPRYGEHMARYWLDLVRFADTNGLHHDHYRQNTPFRDWVIRAFNDNLSFDQFTKYQIAGDLFAEPSIDQRIASGFNRLHLIIDSGTALPQESFTRNVVDRVTAVGTAFLGLTVQCAVCHDHKYDPMTQKDFYQLFAFFNNLDAASETSMSPDTSEFQRGLQPPYIQFPSPEQTARLERVRSEIARLEKQVAEFQQAQAGADAGEDGEALKAVKQNLEERRAERVAIEVAIPATHVMKERAEVRPAHILVRGVYDQPGERVERDTPAFLPPMRNAKSPPSRMDFADWLVDAANPLPARVTVNRFWQQFFGVGIVKTSEDFGAQGEWPSHPALLDYLAISFVRSGWDVKKLVREMVLSETYRQSSKSSSESYVSDPDNRLLARGPRFRLAAEMIRDQVLAVGGLLNPMLYGRSVKPPQPEGLWISVAMPSSYPRVYEADAGDKIYRRSVYTFWKRAIPPPQMTIFDAPMRESCVARRERTNTPLQALLLMNEKQFFQSAAHCANDVLRKPGVTEDHRIKFAYERVTSQVPGEAEMESLRNALRAFRGIYADDIVSAQDVARNLPEGAVAGVRPAELAAWTMLVHSMLNLDITKTRQ